MRPNVKQIITFSAALFLITILLGFYSCSSSKSRVHGVVTPDVDYLRKAHDAEWLDAGRGPLACFNVTVPASGGPATIVPDRAADFHINVTEYLTPPQCEDCILLSEFYPVYDGLATTVIIKNPFPGWLSLNAYDVRLVILTPWQVAFPSGHTANGLINPDGYTGQYKSEKYMSNINPYIHFGDFSNGYTIIPGDSQARELRLYTHEAFVEFTMIVDVSWKPSSAIESGHSKEAHWIDASLIGCFIPGNRGVMVSVDVYDWQNDACDARVLVEAPTLALGFQELQLLETKDQESASFVGFIQSTEDYIAPENPILISVIDPFTKKDGTHPVAYMLEWFNVD